ncbi:Fur family transcriptional regulator [Hoeflea prorocentri]|uniref:Fur family transcriptional regulator n=2 Tax=Hoeflea prorocentri TaxID=1922333 RepID=A0A9X3ZJ95_9HYPH|nr:Fur family transcriptional regulator [Hoeflea prorocentri]MCY6382696.1 Fur family transcriptional regulator [Hoeflea prorocentri]MDA5400496.1 Fur family transcriptional regulator [Hoeflea prorocentri]
MGHSEHVHPDLTKNQSLVMGALSQAKVPMSAYTILDQLREEGFRAPLQVYRALDKLVEFGMVHRLESLNAFVACSHPNCESHETIAFTICEICGQVRELSDDDLSDRLDEIAGKANFALKRSVVELSGICRSCGDH